MRSTFSTSIRRYMRWPVPLLEGLSWRKLGFPEAEHVTGQAAKTADLANAEIELVGNDDLAGDGFPSQQSLQVYACGIHGRGG